MEKKTVKEEENKVLSDIIEVVDFSEYLSLDAKSVFCGMNTQLLFSCLNLLRANVNKCPNICLDKNTAAILLTALEEILNIISRYGSDFWKKTELLIFTSDAELLIELYEVDLTPLARIIETFYIIQQETITRSIGDKTDVIQNISALETILKGFVSSEDVGLKVYNI